MTLGTGGAMGATRGAAMAWGAAGGIAGQGISDIGEIYGTETKSLDEVRARDYLLAGAMGTVGGYAGHKARVPGRAGPSQAEKAGVIAEQGQSVRPETPTPAAAAASTADVNVQSAIKPAAPNAPEAPSRGLPRVAGGSQGAAVVEQGKFDYLFGRTTGRQHNLARSNQNALQMKRLGVPDTAEGHALLRQHFDDVIAQEGNVVNKFANEHGSFEVRESLFPGPSGKFSKFETTFEMLPDGSRRLVTVIPRGGGR
jgi:hypothetical protein